MSNTAIWGVFGHIWVMAWMPRMWAGLCRGASWLRFCMVCRTCGVIRVGLLKFSPPCTIRCPTAWGVWFCRVVFRVSLTSCMAVVWLGMGWVWVCFWLVCRLWWVWVPWGSVMRSMIPVARGVWLFWVVLLSWYFREDEPLLITRMSIFCLSVWFSCFVLVLLLLLLCLLYLLLYSRGIGRLLVC